MAALKRRGLDVAPFKVGPDFIDPGHHSRITGAVSRNLDGWMLPKNYNLKCFRRNARKADVAVAEGVMGLFDGYDGRSEAGSTAQMAKWLGLPVMLVVNAKSMARSAAALVQGFERFDKDLTFAGVIFNNIGSKRHFEYLKEALEGDVKMLCLGGIPYDKGITMPERHLGLVTSQDHPLSDEYKDRLADHIEKNIDIKTLLDLLPEVKSTEEKSEDAAFTIRANVKIGLARDNAFCFYYQDNLEMLEKNGAQLVEFSPMDDKSLPENLDGIYLGGGYPELFAKQLSDNVKMRRQIKESSKKGMPVYGECGGFMYLCREIWDTKGNTYPMVGCFDFATQMFTRLKSLGYREIKLVRDTLTGKLGETIRGHEFHYSEIKVPRDKNGDKNGDRNKVETVYDVSARTGINKTDEGYLVNRTLGSYIHLHFGSRPEAASCFVEHCRNYKREKR